METPLHIAAKLTGGEKCAEMLFKSGADVNSTRDVSNHSLLLLSPSVTVKSRGDIGFGWCFPTFSFRTSTHSSCAQHNAFLHIIDVLSSNMWTPADPDWERNRQDFVKVAHAQTLSPSRSSYMDWNSVLSTNFIYYLKKKPLTILIERIFGTHSYALEFLRRSPDWSKTWQWHTRMSSILGSWLTLLN